MPVDSIRDAITRRLRDRPPPDVRADHWRHVRFLYRRQSGAPLWLSRRGTDRDRVRELADAVREAAGDALRLENLPLAAAVEALEAARSRRPTADQLASADVALSALYVGLGEALLTGQTNPRTVLQSWYISPREERVDSTLGTALATTPLRESLRRLHPQDPGYAALRAELARYRDLAAGEPWPRVPAGPNVAPGDSEAAARVSLLRRRLELEGYLAGARRSRATVPTGRLRYDSALAGSVATFQERHGIVVDSVLGPETVASLNVPASYRLAQIAANLERYRWLPRQLGDRYVLVNVPAFRLQAFENGREALSMKVIVGSEYEGRATPVFADSMQFVVFRPYWNVPDSIAARELRPKEDSSPGYLEAHRYETLASEGKVRLRQKPGPGNALGLVKFMFPNDFDIYLHDTPEDRLFEKDVRAFSHGCIRLERPAELAEWVLGWPADSVRRQMEEGRDDHRVDLPRRLPVYIAYLTAYVRDGALHFGNDLYDRDAAMVRSGARGAAPAAATLQLLDRLRRLAR